MNRTKRLVTTGLLIAVGIILPLAFHGVPDGGRVFLPMHIPVLLCGLIVGPICGVICGIITPVLSSLMTGMPPIALLPGMIFELAAYGLISGLLFRLIKTKHVTLNIYISLIFAMIIGRGVSGFMNGLIFLSGKYSVTAWVSASFVIAWPGIIIQLVLIPALVFALLKAGLIEFDLRDVWGVRFAKASKRNREFFDGIADTWDANSTLSPERISQLISKCKIKEGDSVLDIACGTGIIDNELIRQGAADVTAIDIADKMIEIAKNKNTNENIKYYNCDFYSYLTRGYDKAIIFNAYPHFTDRHAFAKRLNSVLRSNGSFIILHSESPDMINSRHQGRVFKLSKALMPTKDEVHNFDKYFNIVETVDDGETYMIYGTKKAKKERKATRKNQVK